MDIRRLRFQAFMGKAPELIPHWEHWSNPDAETELTGIDYYAHPRLCRLEMRRLYPELDLPVPETDTPIKRTETDLVSSHTVRWGDGQTATFLHGEQFFKTEEDVFSFSPLAHADMRSWPFVVENWDFSSDETVESHLKKRFPGEWGRPEEGVDSNVSFYNTTFMWPLLSFGWEMFLNCCLDAEFERIMDEFAEINRRVFKAFCKLPVNFVICHDDIMTSHGPVCSPGWMNKYVFPRYEEYWSMVKASGKEVIFMVDGCADRYADDIFACGARGIISEPYTDYRAIAKKHKDAFVAGEGDNRILMRNDPAEIRSMVEKMKRTADMTGGYTACIGNHIPWNVPAEAIRRYFDYAREMLRR